MRGGALFVKTMLLLPMVIFFAQFQGKALGFAPFPAIRGYCSEATQAGRWSPFNYQSQSSWRILPRMMAQVSEKEAQGGIDKVVNALRKDKTATTELGRLVKVTNVLGYGSPKPGTLAVRFNASFQKGGMGRSAVPLPFGLGQSNVSEGRGSMVGQVKASLDSKNGKILNCSVFRDLGYGRAFNLKV